MSTDQNALGQPIGPALPDWQSVAVPARTVMTGRFTRLEPYEPDQHGVALFTAFSTDQTGANWTWLPYGPFETVEDFLAFTSNWGDSDDPLFFTIFDQNSDKPVGLASWLRIVPDHGVIEVGHLHFSPLMQQTPIATEAMYLMMQRAFDLGYRRYEWKCNSLNQPSCNAATRLGFSYEGCFRQAQVVKGHSRDTNWYSILDSEWPAIKQGFETWLDPQNFDAADQQIQSLADCRPNL